MELKSDKTEILLVEDREEGGELALMGLEGLTRCVKWIRDGEEALDFLFSRGKYLMKMDLDQPKLILLDIKLHKISGLEVLKQVKSNPVTRRIPVTMLTTSTDERDMLEAYNLGVNSYITKPVNFTQFESTVKYVGKYWLEINKAHNTL